MRMVHGLKWVVGQERSTSSSLNVSVVTFLKSKCHFYAALQLFGKDWQKVQEYIKTRSSAQIRSHAQKFFNQVKKKGGTVIIKNHKTQHRKRKRNDRFDEDDVNFI